MAKIQARQRALNPQEQLSGDHFSCQDVVCRVPTSKMDIGKVTQPPEQTVRVRSEPIHVNVEMPVVEAPRITNIRYFHDSEGRLTAAIAK